MTAQTPTEGRIVHVYKRDAGHCIPAIVVRAFGGTAVNVLLFPDGTNDGYQPAVIDPQHGARYALPWATSVPADESENRAANFEVSWHWPERAEERTALEDPEAEAKP
jgi:hypothetical protein